MRPISSAVLLTVGVLMGFTLRSCVTELSARTQPVEQLPPPVEPPSSGNGAPSEHKVAVEPFWFPVHFFRRSVRTLEEIETDVPRARRALEALGVEVGSTVIFLFGFWVIFK